MNKVSPSSSVETGDSAIINRKLMMELKIIGIMYLVVIENH